MELKELFNGIALVKDGIEFGVKKNTNEYSVETSPFLNNAVFSIALEEDEAVFLTFLDFIKNLIATYQDNNLKNSFMRYGDNKIVLQSDGAVDDYLEIVFSEASITFNFIINREVRYNNRISFYRNCALIHGYYKCFDVLLEELREIMVSRRSR